ncbi:hypothetical protein KO500_11565 [Cellulophaga baltica]|uniref:DUF5723 family protein n=1 Tax=Cellulophaga TaxID=104264 RepID=UPI001C076DE3|nr:MULTISPECIES: DUF5723 family protein [Cellulophaga]MBU2997077.1 hypothetical protein [Cellulophaga baltica]MDO6768475.1 DUF5723 family protein [Cellulophaga sp. 1_MG-2023]
MKSIYLSIVVFFIACLSGISQNKELLYNFNEVPQSLLLNPGTSTSFKWYAGVPVLSGVSFQAGVTGITSNDLFAVDGVDFNTKFLDKVVYGMDSKDELSGTYQIEILNVGFRGRKNPNNFYSFGIYNEGDAIGYYFEDYALLAFEGNTNNIDKRFDLSDLKTRGEVVNVYHFGINKKVSRQLDLGFRAKVYSSILNFSSTDNSGYFVTTEGDENLLQATLVADLKINTSGIFELKDAIDNDESIADIITKRALFGGDLGLGFDLGFTYKLDRQTYITGSILDIGFISHTNDLRTYSLKGKATSEGINVILPDDLGSGSDEWRELVDDLESLVPYEETEERYVTFRPTKLYASIGHDFGDEIEPRQDCNCTTKPGGGYVDNIYKNSVGGQLYVINRPRGPQAALTGFYQHRFGNIMSLKATYTVDKYSFANVGLGGSLQAGPVNMYLMADNLFGYSNLANTNYASVLFGLNIISWGKK